MSEWNKSDKIVNINIVKAKKIGDLTGGLCAQIEADGYIWEESLYGMDIGRMKSIVRNLESHMNSDLLQKFSESYNKLKTIHDLEGMD